MRARIVHHSEYLALSLLLIGAAVWQKDQITAWFWFWLLAPDLFGYVPAFFFGRPPAKGYLPPRAVWLYNLWHNFTLPVALFVALLLLFAGNPWPLLGWLLHISVDRLVGFGLRGEDGGQALI
ncbi:MAG TPA: DUF4260 family protein [Candidatus Limnocylindria bacterium]|nr:DUF4260 family protein [Candidatus Limnocylindria bacterium]